MTTGVESQERDFSSASSEVDGVGVAGRGGSESVWPWSKAYSPLGLQALIKQSPDDFLVREKLGFNPTGEGQHLYLYLEKKLLSTAQVVSLLSRFFRIHPRDIGYAGLKDRFSVSCQWFSVDLAGSKKNEHDLALFESEISSLISEMCCDEKYTSQVDEAPSVNLLNAVKNNRKLKIGTPLINSFEISVRQIKRQSGSSKNDSGVSLIEMLESRLGEIKCQGFPNYFGPQRFGNRMQNIRKLDQANELALEKRRQLRSSMISTLRALGFNQYLSKRIDRGSQNLFMDGDVLKFRRGGSLIAEGECGDTLQQRVDSGELVITGPLIGFDEGMAAGKSMDLEREIKSGLASHLALLERFKVKSSRRALYAFPENMHWNFLGNDLFLRFELDSGCYATSLMNELVDNVQVLRL